MTLSPETPQYTPRGISRYERIFGRDFVSTGGLESTRTLVAPLGLQKGMKVLDVGSGLGGSAFFMAREYGVQVLGLDVLPQMVEDAQQRAAAHGLSGVTFRQGDILDADLPEAPFDLIYSRDALIHIPDKPALFGRLFGLLKEGGTLFLTDYARGPLPVADAFEQYRIDTNYTLHDLETYGSFVSGAGFRDVQVRDLTAQFVEVLHREMDAIRNEDTSDPEALTPADRDYLLERWERKVGYCNAGDMRWCSIQATK